MSEIYRSTVTDAGPLATSFLDEGMLVTFGADAPDELREFCFILAPAQTVAAIEAGQILWIDRHAFAITAVGEVAQRNLDALGHVTIKLDASTEASLAGAIHVASSNQQPTPAVGSTLVIEAT